MGLLFALGSNGSGQLGIGHEDDVSHPTKSLFPELDESADILKIAAGGNHTLVLLSDGTLLTAGETSDGRCFPAEREPEQECSKQPIFRKARIGNKDLPNLKVRLCSATWEASTCVLANGEVVTGGTGNKGELGLGRGISIASQRQVIVNFPPPGTRIVDITAGMSHTVAVLSNGDVYGWGAGRKGQLGQVVAEQWSPHKIDGVPFHACRAACGKDFTYIVGHPDEGKHIVLGSDKWSVISDAPATVPLWKEIGASWGSIFVLLESGFILSWGRNDHKQLSPPSLPTVQHIAIGSEHAIALTKHGSVIAWGWGEHGNCGAIDDPSNVDFASNELRFSHSVKALGAGCATSWIVTSNG